MGRVLAVGLAACLLAPIPCNLVGEFPLHQLPASIDTQVDRPAAAIRRAQVEPRKLSGDEGLILLMTIALKGLHGS